MQRPLAIGSILKGKYRITRLVGGGGMAWVYQVEQLPAGSKSLWALKELRPQTEDEAERATARRLFEQEADILSRLDHPNLPRVIDFFEEDGRACLVMEFVWGESLEKRLEVANAPLLEADVLRWAVQLCEVLDYLHSQEPPIIFRDLKPSNVMVTNTGQVKLIDFGIARTYKVGKKRDTVAMGSENYAAPEQWGQGQTDARSDLYSLGATMYHLLANVAPTPAFLPTPPLPLRDYNGALSEATVRVVGKAMERDDRARRFASAVEMRQALLNALPAPYVPPPAAAAQPAPGLQPRPAPAVPRPRPKPVAAPPRPCPACGRASKAEARFCAGCGHSFVGLRPAVLRIVQPVRAAWEMPVHKSPMLLGRISQPEDHVPDFDMAFYDDGGYVSRRHAHITRQGDGYFITDMGSSNGTVVNGRPLVAHQPRELRNGDHVTIGQVVIQFWLR